MDRDNIFFARDDDDFDPEEQELFLQIGMAIEMENTIPFIYAPNKVENIEAFAGIMQEFAAQSDADVSYEIGEYRRRSGSVLVTGKRFYVKDPWRFVKAVRDAQGLEVYPKTNGDICLWFSFHDLDKI